MKSCFFLKQYSQTWDVKKYRKSGNKGLRLKLSDVLELGIKTVGIHFISESCKAPAG